MKFKNKKPTRILRTTSGMTLVEILMVVGLTGVVMTSIISMLQISAKQQLQATLTFQAQQIEKNITKLLNDPNGWKNTYAANASNGATSMSCLQNAQPCTTTGAEKNAGGVAVSGKPIYKIVDSANNVVYDLTGATTGFTPTTGKTCATWVTPPTVPSNNLCPLRFDVTWDAVCTGASCVNPGAMIHVKASYNPDPKLRVTFNAGNYSTDFYQGSDGSLACQWGWSVSNNQLTEVCAPFVGIGVDATTHFATRMEVYGMEKVYGRGGGIDTNGNNAVYLNAAGLDAGVSGVAIGFGNTFNGVNMANTAYISAEAQGSVYRNIVLNPLATGSGNGMVGINTVSPSAPLDVQTDGDHKMLVRRGVSIGDANGINSVNGNNSAWKPLELSGAPVVLQNQGGGANYSNGTFNINGDSTVNGNQAIGGSNVTYGNGQVNGQFTAASNATIGGALQVNGSENVSGNLNVSGNTQVNGTLATSNNLYVGALGNWITAYLNQGVRTDNAPTFAGLNVNGASNLNNGDTTINNGQFYVNQGGQPRFTVKNGNIGVGTSNPTWMFEVHQNGASGGQAFIALTDANVTVGFNISAVAGGGAAGQIGTVSGHPFSLYAGNTPFTTLYASSVLVHAGNIRANAFVTASDIRLKKDIHPIENPLENLLKLEGREFTWKKSGKKEVGFIAQQIEKVYPELVVETEGEIDGKHTKHVKGVEYANVVAIIVEAIRELSSKVDILIGKVDQLLTQQASLAKENQELRARLDALDGGKTQTSQQSSQATSN